MVFVFAVNNTTIETEILYISISLFKLYFTWQWNKVWIKSSFEKEIVRKNA